CRKLLRNVLQSKTAPNALYEQLQQQNKTLPIYAQDSVLDIPELSDKQADRKQLQEAGKKVLDIMRSADALPAEQRDAHVRAQLDLIDRVATPAASQSVESVAV